MKTPERRQASSGVVGEQLNLIDPPPFSPSFPSRSSLLGRALSMLLNARGGITTPDFQAATKSWRLAAYVYQLITEYGWPIEALEIPFSDDSSRFIAKYYLPRWVLQEVGTTRR